MGILPIFVFDGPKRPRFKRSKNISTSGWGGIKSKLVELIESFGFVAWHAPGEAEAECASLQANGIVDVVWTEDIDAFVFGATRVWRDWIPDQAVSSNSKASTHILEYKDCQKLCKLSPKRMLLIGLLSGSDYDLKGLKGCGKELAVEIAMSGYAESMPDSNDQQAWMAWREEINKDLRLNKNKNFKKKHPSIQITETFPNWEVYEYYTNPIITAKENYQKVNWIGPDPVRILRFTQKTFSWSGCTSMLRSICTPLLAYSLRNQSSEIRLSNSSKLEGLGPKSQRSENIDGYFKATKLITKSDCKLILGVHSQRNHISVDEMTELRVSFVPISVVSDEEVFNFQVGSPSKSGVSPKKNAVKDYGDHHDDCDDSESNEDAGKIVDLKVFNPNIPIRVWLPASLVRQCAPTKVLEWEKQKLKYSPSKKTPPVSLLNPDFKIDKYFNKFNESHLDALSLEHIDSGIIIQDAANVQTDYSSIFRGESHVTSSTTKTPTKSKKLLSPPKQSRNSDKDKYSVKLVKTVLSSDPSSTPEPSVSKTSQAYRQDNIFNAKNNLVYLVSSSSSENDYGSQFDSGNSNISWARLAEEELATPSKPASHLATDITLQTQRLSLNNNNFDFLENTNCRLFTNNGTGRYRLRDSSPGIFTESEDGSQVFEADQIDLT